MIKYIKSRGGLLVLATNIMALDIEERLLVHAEKMLGCEEQEYSRAFYEVAKKLMDLLVLGYSLEDGVKTLTGRIQAIEDIPHQIKWGGTYDTDQEALTSYAKIVVKTGIDGPDFKLAKRLLSKKASVDEWKLAALRFTDIVRRVDTNNKNLPEFLDDVDRNKKEFADLNKNIARVTMENDRFDMDVPLFPPWTDIGCWHDNWSRFGFGYSDDYRPEVVDVPLDTLKGPAAKGDVLASILGTATSIQRRVRSFLGQLQIKNVDAPHTHTSPVHQNVVKETVTCIEEKDDISVEATDLSMDPKGNKPALLVKDLIDVEWPSLPASADKATSQPAGGARNAWTDLNRKKKFMNSGIAKDKRKLRYSPPVSTATDYIIDVPRAYSIKEIWGYSLLGQYVGRHPGHHAITAMMKLWGVKANYKIEEGWMIFRFDNEEDQEKVLIGGPYMIHGRPLIIKHVPDKFAFTNQEFATVPLWIRIYGLGSRFWTDEFLGGIASYVGKPLYLDSVTDRRQRNSYARVLVEVNLAEEVIRKVPIKFSDRDSFVCKIQIETSPCFATSVMLLDTR